MACGQCVWGILCGTMDPPGPLHLIQTFTRLLGDPLMWVSFLHARGGGGWVGFEEDVAVCGVGVRAWTLGFIENDDGSKCAHRGSAAGWWFTCMRVGSGTLNPKS